MNEYQKSYYEKNKEKLKQKARERRAQKQDHHLTLVPDAPVEKPIERLERRQEAPVHKLETPERVQVSNLERLKLGIWILLSTTLTLLLLTQMVGFYSSDPWLVRVLKAGSLEGLILFFSTLPHSHCGGRVAYRGLAGAMCLLSLYTMSATQLDAYVLNAQKHEIAFKTVQEIERSIEKKETLQTGYLKGSWLTAAKRNAGDLTQLNEKLENTRGTWVSTFSQYNTLMVDLLTRVFFMLGNILLFRTILKRVTDKGM